MIRNSGYRFPGKIDANDLLRTQGARVHSPTMPQHIGYIALLVRDYDEAISYFIEKLGLTVAEDTDLGGGKRWVLVAPPGAVESRLVLAKAVSADELARVGNQTGGRVFLFLHTDISGATTRPIAQAACYSARNHGKKRMGSLPCSKTFMETVGT
jgi:catechol 2,3-dioxygenase-like lactoylglutathione lyase family enzyme